MAVRTIPSPLSRVLIYMGTYTQGDEPGIHFGNLDLSSGRLELLGSVACLQNPSFVCVDERRLRLYAVHEINDYAGQKSGAVSAFRLDPDSGQPVLLNSRPSGGAGPCHLSIAPDGSCLLAANYEGGSVALLPLEADGQLAEMLDVVIHQGSSINKERQDRPHAHCVVFAPGTRSALAADLGTDEIFLYEPQAGGREFASHEPQRVSVKAGDGPRHLAFGPEGGVLYVINELASTVTVWERDEEDMLRQAQAVSTLPPDAEGESSAMEVQVHPSGRFLYASNSGYGSLMGYHIEAGTGRLTPLGSTPSGGSGPRHFSIASTGTQLIVAHEHSGTVTSFAIHPETGALTPTGHSLKLPNVVCAQVTALPAP